jgi:hypothetical protein
MKIQLSTSRKKGKSKNPRSIFLSAFMREVSNEPQVAEHFTSGNLEEFKKAFDTIRDKLASEVGQ